ncbi:type II secretion system minor pseudopilin GspJ [Aestuariicella hydrocarbonica]|uniref:Type II secretion system protein J n=1 Tax=Pseudomaricurvus hydrocarbonicus TaxID=1470433 RepID=A0A9E5JR00_9GAMM|nr:type II secretion system minor pseudopilin GspJ [Aestuariicella hydrocarbonica]NHO63943.1 type II secretion system minor pseudopilin GspJ [Aestuariicella hydrocarbonica]
MLSNTVTHTKITTDLGRCNGFTLLEVLIALSIFAILGLASYQLLGTEVRTQLALQNQSLEQNHWQLGMMRLTRDLQQAVNRGIREDYGLREPALLGNEDSIIFTRHGWVNPLQRSRSDLQRVAYRIQQDTDGQPYLQRSFWFYLDRAPATEPVNQQLLPGIEQLKLRYLQVGSQEWLTVWPPLNQATSGLPEAIEVTVHSSDWGDIQRLVTLQLTREKLQ